MPQQNGYSINGNTNPVLREVTVIGHTIGFYYLSPMTFHNNNPHIVESEPPLVYRASDDWENELYSSIRSLLDKNHSLMHLGFYLPSSTVIDLLPNEFPWKAGIPTNVGNLDGVVLAAGLWLGRQLGLPLEEVRSSIQGYLVDKRALERIINELDPVTENK